MGNTARTHRAPWGGGVRPSALSTHWQVRGYGQIAANPFGLADFDSGYRRCGDRTPAADGRATFRYRVLWHAGDAAQARVGERYLDRAEPVVTVAD